MDLKDRAMVSYFIRQRAAALGEIDVHSHFRVGDVSTDRLGHSHAQVQQYYKNVPIFGAKLALHTDAEGTLYFINGRTEMPNLGSVTPGIDGEKALQLAMNDIDAAVYAWENPVLENAVKRIFNDNSRTLKPTPELMIVPDILGGAANKFHLAYKMKITVQSPHASEWLYFVDAVSGSIIHKIDTCAHAVTPANGQTLHYGVQSFNSNSTTVRKKGQTTTTYQLKDTVRKISTYRTTRVGGRTKDITDSDNYWDGDSYLKSGVESHWGTTMIYDYLQGIGRNSIDGNGMEIIVNTGVDRDSWGYFPNNAMWYANQMWIGSGNGGSWDHLSSVDIVAHEMGHGVTDSESNLTYSYESGALNEAFSDMMGVAVEFSALPAIADWKMGERSYYPNDLNRALRYMDNPNAGGQPDTYLGSSWYSGSQDNGGVHTNSGVANFHFYLLSAGGQGTNDNGTAYNVQGIGVVKAFQIWYHANCNFFTSSTNYASARTLTIQAAEDLFGTGSTEATQTANAWSAVGVN